MSYTLLVSTKCLYCIIILRLWLYHTTQNEQTYFLTQYKRRGWCPAVPYNCMEYITNFLSNDHQQMV